MLSGMLYGKRFFPYYVNNILGGIDEDGKGCVYSFDPVVRTLEILLWRPFVPPPSLFLRLSFQHWHCHRRY